MSLILDAIKKSERERQQQGVPDLGANHGDYQGKSSSRNWWPIIIIAVLVLLLAGIYFGNFTDHSSADKKVLAEPVIVEEKQPQIIKVVPLVENNKKEFPLKQPEQITPEQPKEAYQPKMVEIKNPVMPEIKPIQQAPVTTLENIPNLNQIPASLQRELPAIQFSSHIFTGDQATSFVVLNDEMLGVGESLNDEIEIIKINKEGLVIEFEEQQIFLNALQNWQP